MKKVLFLFVFSFLSAQFSNAQDYPPPEINSDRELNCTFSAETGEIDGIPEIPQPITGSEKIKINY